MLRAFLLCAILAGRINPDPKVADGSAADRVSHPWRYLVSKSGHLFPTLEEASADAVAADAKAAEEAPVEVAAPAEAEVNVGSAYASFFSENKYLIAAGAAGLAVLAAFAVTRK